MSPKMLKLFRSIQVHFPYLQDYKFSVQRQMRALLNKTHEEDFEIIPHLPLNSTTFVDIGANRGDAIHSILMRSPRAEIVAFEPNLFLCEKLDQLYGSNSHVNIQRCGLGNANSNFDLFIPFYNNYMFDGLASFKEQHARDWLTNRIYNFDKSKLQVKKMSCAVRKLDDFELNPGFIKIDVQGFEYEVLEGAVKTLAANRPIVLMESPGQNELDFMNDLRYESFLFKDRQLISGSKYYNIFFVPVEMIDKVSRKVPMRFSAPIAA